MEFQKSRLQILKDLINRQQIAAINQKPRITTEEFIISSPPCSPVPSQDIVDSISPARSPLRARRTKSFNFSSPPSTPPSKKPDINDIDSPNSSEPSKLAKKRKLAEELKRTLKNHKTAIRNWESAGDKNISRAIQPALGDGNGMDLIIQKSFSLGGQGRSKGGGLNFGPTLALCFEVAVNTSLMPGANNYELIQPPKWMCFNPRVPTEIGEGTVGKLHPPWQTIFAPSIGEEVILCTDFFKIFNAAEVPRNLKTLLFTGNTIADEMVAKMFSGDYDSSLRGLLPYAYTNSNTLTKQTHGPKRLINLDVVICETWRSSSDNCALLLVKDSDNFLALVEAAEYPNGEFGLNSLKPGAFCKFKDLHVLERITTARSLPLFSVISLFNHDQPKVDKFYYVCQVIPDTKVEIVPVEISFDGPCILKVPTNHLLQCPQNRDCRFHVEGTLTKKSNSSTEVILSDESGTIGIRVMPSFEWDQLIFDERISLIYLRTFRGVCTLDRFSIIKRSTES